MAGHHSAELVCKITEKIFYSEEKMLQTLKNLTFYPHYPKKVLLLHPKQWRDGRVVDYSGLENRRTERYRGFESLSLRNADCKLMSCDIIVHFYTLFAEQTPDFPPYSAGNWVFLFLNATNQQH